jgi:hypothetical protein
VSSGTQPKRQRPTSVIPREAISRAKTNGSSPDNRKNMRESPGKSEGIVDPDHLGTHHRSLGGSNILSMRPSMKYMSPPSPYSPNPCGGASAIRTTILLAVDLQSIANASPRAAVMASGPSPPPDANNDLSCSCTFLISEEKPKFLVTYV